MKSFIGFLMFTFLCGMVSAQEENELKSETGVFKIPERNLPGSIEMDSLKRKGGVRIEIPSLAENNQNKMPEYYADPNIDYKILKWYPPDDVDYKSLKAPYIIGKLDKPDSLKRKALPEPRLRLP